MRHRNLVFTAFLAIFIGFSAATVEAQKTRPSEEVTPNIVGKVEDLAGRSIRHAQITLFCLDSDEVVRVQTNAFGYYRITGLTNGHTYLLAGIEHRKYLFLISSFNFTVGDKTLEFDFQGEFAR